MGQNVCRPKVHVSMAVAETKVSARVPEKCPRVLSFRQENGGY